MRKAKYLSNGINQVIQAQDALTTYCPRKDIVNMKTKSTKRKKNPPKKPEPMSKFSWPKNAKTPKV